MSAYKVVECQIQKEEYIVAALMDLGIPRENIETHAEPTNLYGYRGDKRTQKANVVVRRKHVNKHLSSGSSNDIGFEKVDGKYEAHISDYDMGWWNRGKGQRFLQVAATHQVVDKAKKKGYHVKKVEEDGKIKLKLTKNF